MPWIIGIDEAGYGPNLGPFVMSSVACRVPEAAGEVDLWDVLKTAVRRGDEADDGRMIVADSKVVYSTDRGLHDLECSVSAFVRCEHDEPPATLHDLLARLALPSSAELNNELWYTGTSILPREADGTLLRKSSAALRKASKVCEVCWGTIHSVVMCPARFNEVVDQWGSKGAVLGHALADLIGANQHPDDDGEPLKFYIDKHGGRNTYAAMLQEAVADGMVVAQEEGMNRSRYRVLGLARDMSFTFQPRADAEHFCVALASMVSKYVRELLMAEFNAFWQTHIPGIKPTAGYPGDSRRFYSQIRPVAQRLCIADDVLWRRR